MRFNTNTASSLSSLPVRIDHGNAAAAGSPAMNANTTRTARNMSVDAVPASVAGTQHPQHVSYMHALQQIVSLKKRYTSSQVLNLAQKEKENL